MSIEVKNLYKSFGSFQALQDVSLRVAKGELVALLGPSGCGKTTLLRIIAGLEHADRGEVLVDELDTAEGKPRDHKIGFVFQHYALFRHMTVFENIAFGLRVLPRSQRPQKKEIDERVHQLLQLVQLDWLADRYPSQLSGGQRQRIALARALAVEPQVLLLDEPFGALDAQVRRELRGWLRQLHEQIHVTSLFVTHDQEEAMELADTVVVMNQGRVVQTGTPDEVYNNPASPFVYNFLGNVNLFHGRIQEGKAYIGDLAVNLPESLPQDSQNASVYIRPQHFQIEQIPSNGYCIPAKVVHIHSAGPQVRLELLSRWGQNFQVEISHEQYRSLQIERGIDVFVSPKEAHVFVEDYII